jgi:hypothetical protein
MTAKIRTFRYVRLDDVSAYLELGWISPEVRPHPHMDRYRVIMEWPHDREAIEPMGQFEAGAFLRGQRWDRGEIAPFRSIADIANRIADKMVADMEYERAAEDAQRRQDAADGFDDE